MEVKNIVGDIDVSIITPFYKGNTYLDNLFRCVRENAKYAPEIRIELVLVNDSPQYEIQYCDGWVQNFELNIVQNQVNSGIQQSRINGIKVARGRFIIMLDQDDLLYEKAVLSQMQAIHNNDIVVGNGFDENPVSSGKIYKSTNQQKRVQNLYYYYFIGNMIVSPGQCMMRKTVVPSEWCSYPVKNNGSDDLLLWVLLLKKDVKWTINTDVIYRHVFTGSNVSADLNKMIKSTYEVVDFLRNQKLIDEAEIKLLKRRMEMRKIYEGKSTIKKAIAYLKYPDIAIGLIKSKI